MKKNKNFGLNENEYKFICDIMKGRVFNLSVSRWRGNTISTMKVLNKFDELESQHDVTFSDIIIKLNLLSDIEFLELIKMALVHWSICSDSEKSYRMKCSMTPSEKIKEILSQTKK